MATNRPLLDVRSEIEFCRSRLPHTVNLPILTTEERHQVGLTYKEEGPHAATALGHELVSGTTRSSRIEMWLEVISRADIPALLCWRGGQRSKIAQQWLADAGISLPRVAGGYKAVRRAILDSMEVEPPTWQLVSLTGRSGVGKSELLQILQPTQPVVDLERLANHRGSVFGTLPGGQPTQSTFENYLAVTLIRERKRSSGPMLIEDESRAVGGLLIPKPVYAAMREAPLFELVASMEERTQRIIADYIELPLEHLDPATGAYPLEVDELETRMEEALTRLLKRMGGKGNSDCLALLKKAFSEHKQGASSEVHTDWVRFLLEGLYDPLYDAHLERNRTRVIMRGNFEELRQRLQEYGPPRIIHSSRAA